ncbi:TPA: hypothetical protein OF523_000665 [Escherichia coli]|nr:hypothetical protein [Escherichia coli]
MTVSTEISHNEYLGNGVTTSFPYTFRIFKDTDLDVSTITADGLVSPMILGTDYMVTGAGLSSGGSVITSSPVLPDITISITRNLPAVQETDLRNQGKFFAEVHEDAFDYLTMLIQHAMFNVGVLQRNTLRVPEASVNLVPKVSSRRNMIFGWDDNGQPIAILPPSASASEVLILLAQPDGWTRIGGAASAQSVTDLDTKVESRNYAKYTKAAELAKLLSAGGTFVIDCYGDSTMWGATAGDLGTQNIYNPPAVLKTTITNLYGVTLTVNNFGISGTTIAQMLAGTDGSGSTFAAKMSSTAATLIYCNHCINDSQLDNDIHQYRLNLMEFVRLCRLYNKVPVLVTPNTNPAVPGAGIITEAKSKRLRNYVKVMREVAHDLDVDLVDNFYYYEQTARMVSPVALVPDGAHPSTEGYKMSGRNMAIPLVSAHTLRKAWDKAGLANSTYFDNIASSRVYQTTGTPANRFDGNLSGVRTSSLTGINLAVILDKPTDDTVMAVYGLQWGSGTISDLYENGFAGGAEFGGQINQFNSVTTIDWDACYIPPRCKLYAGLHVIGLLTSTAVSGASGEGFGLSGLGLVPRVENGSGMTSADEIRNFNVICTNSELTFDLPLFSIGTQFTLKGCSNNTPVINIDWAGTGAALTLTTSLGGSYTIASSVTPAVYRARLKFNSDKTISVTVGAASITIPAGTSPWPNMYVGTLGQRYSVKYLG